MVNSKIIIKLSALVAVALLTGCTNNDNLRPQSYKYETYPRNPNYAIIKPTKDKEFSEENLACMIKDLEGRPYVWAEEGPYCFDCSGYLYYMFGKMGVDIPRTAREQIKSGQPVAFEDLKFGDLVFFDTTRNRSGRITHVGMYLKDGWFTQASSSHKQIIYTNFNTDQYYRSRFVAARRYYEKNGNKYAVLQPKMQNELTHMIASNASSDVRSEFKPVSILASNASATANMQNIRFTESKVIEKQTVTIAQNSATIPLNKINGEVAYEDLQKIGTSNDYSIKEESVAINSTEAMNNAPIKSTDLSIAVKKSEDTVAASMPAEQIAKTETKYSNVSNKYYVQVGKFQSKPDKNFLNKIKAEGYAYTIMPISENGKLASKILIGPFKDNHEASGKLNDVKESIVKEAFVTKVNS